MFFWNRKRKSRKQLLQEIEELKAEKQKYFNWWEDKSDALIRINRQIKTVNAVCISNSRDVNEEQIQSSVIDCLCRDLAKEIIPYVTFETYRMVGEPWNGEAKHIATVHIVDC